MGYVVFGVQYTTPEGKHGEIQISSGSCFAISEDGYLLTNRHVVEHYDQLEKASGLENRKYVFITMPFAAELEGLKQKDPTKYAAVRAMFKKVSAEKEYSRLEPCFWVFFNRPGGRPEKVLARIDEICDESEYDLAILKVDRKRRPFFASPGRRRSWPRAARSSRSGSPRRAWRPISLEEIREKELREHVGTKIESLQVDRAFDFVRNDGRVSQDFPEGRAAAAAAGASTTPRSILATRAAR